MMQSGRVHWVPWYTGIPAPHDGVEDDGIFPIRHLVVRMGDPDDPAEMTKTFLWKDDQWVPFSLRFSEPYVVLNTPDHWSPFYS